MNTKMIFMDMDGTALDDEKNLPKVNKEAIDEALEQGHKVIVCTGRPLSSVVNLLPMLGLDQGGCYAITYNGGLIYDAGEKKAVYKKTLPLDQVRYIFEKAYEFEKIHVQTYTDEGFICEYDTPESVFYENSTHCRRKIVKDVFEELNGQEPCKILAMAYGFERSRIEAFRDLICDYAEEKMDLFFSCNEYLEIVPTGINKGNAIRWMSEYLNIPMENTIAVGDAENDITMIVTAAVGAVMKNAKDEMKKYGNYVTQKNNNEGGVAEVIRLFMLNDTAGNE